MPSEKLLESLNHAQYQAVTLPPSRSALILAGAGSGKTRVLTTRIAWLIQHQQVNPHTILAVTFTNKAAKEMQVRLEHLLQHQPPRWIGTFHGLCHRLLRLHWREANLSADFQILDQGEQLTLIKRLLKQQAIDDKRHPPKLVQAFINHAKESGQRPADISAQDPISTERLEFYRQYSQQCAQNGLVDFAELLLRADELLQQPALREHYQTRFQYILVDEFQDTNPLQYRWLQHLAGKNPVLAVGDDDQSIYAFRGACVGNLQHFIEDFALNPQQDVIRLEQNYRSYSNILNAANALIAHNNSRLGKNLWTTADQGELVRVLAAESDRTEAEFVAQTLKQAGVNWQNCAVLYRTNAQSRALEHALFQAGIPYRVYGGLRFFERQEIKHALAYLRLALHPQDDHALLRVINVPTRGIGAKTLAQLQQQAQTQQQSLWHTLIHTPATGRAANGLRQLVQTLQACQQAATQLPLAQSVAKIIELSGLAALYQQDPNEQERWQNLQELVSAAGLFVQEEGQSISEFLAHAALEAGENTTHSGDCVSLMTIHAAKGLEFSWVFVCGLEAGLFPLEYGNSPSRVSSAAFEEERRLMYVAMTRAQHQLYLTWARARLLNGEKRFNHPSPFLEEIPPQLLEHLRDNIPRFHPSFSANLVRQSSPSATPTFVRQDSPWFVGQTVTHPKFGSGTVLALEGNNVLQVRFASVGIKHLDLAYAKLSAAAR